MYRHPPERDREQQGCNRLDHAAGKGGGRHIPSRTSFNLAFAPGTYQIQVTNGGTKTVIYDSGATAYTPNIAFSFITYAPTMRRATRT